MTGFELQEYFGTHLNQLNSRLMLDEKDVFYWLNQAQDKMIHEAFLEYDRDRRIGDIVRLLSTSLSINTTKDTATDNDKALLPDNYRYPLAMTGKILYKKGGITIVSGTPRTSEGVFSTDTRLIRIVQLDDVYRLLGDPFNKPTKREPLATIQGTYVLVYNTPEFFVSVLYLNYIRKATDVSRDDGCELPSQYHTTLVETGVSLYLRATGGVSDKQDSVPE